MKTIRIILRVPKVRAFLAVFCLAALASPAAQDSRKILTFSLGPGYDIGYSSYEIFIADGSFRSRLDFPLDSFPVAGSAAVTFLDGRGRPTFGLSASVSLSLTDPLLPMIDNDWVEPEGYLPFLFSSTRSDVRLDSVRAALSLEKPYLFRGHRSPAGTLGIIYSHVSQAVMGYSGWQVDILGSGATGETRDISGSGEVLSYTVDYILPYAGLLWTFRPFAGFSLDAGADLVLGWASDTDDHLLRNMTKKGSGFGVGARGTVRVGYTAGTGTVRPWVSLNLTYLRVGLRGDEVTEWYGNDPATRDFDETGLRSPSIPHEFEYFRYSASVELGVRITF